jgi:hypothetical protein
LKPTAERHSESGAKKSEHAAPFRPRVEFIFGGAFVEIPDCDSNRFQMFAAPGKIIETIDQSVRSILRHHQASLLCIIGKKILAD